MAVQRAVRRPGRNPGSYEPSPEELKKTKRFNANLRYVQGFRTSIAASSSVTQNVVFTAPGRLLLGVSFIPGLQTFDINDILVTLVVNNNNVLLNMSAANANPTQAQGMIFFPVPQPLQGNDQFSITYNNTFVAIAGTITANFFYVPK